MVVFSMSCTFSVYVPHFLSGALAVVGYGDVHRNLAVASLGTSCAVTMAEQARATQVVRIVFMFSLFFMVL